MNTNQSTETIITRYPPSPTGLFNVGQARVVLYNYLFAMQNKGTFVFRFEDTDRARSKKEYEANFFESLAWLGITEFEPPHRQSERTHIYRSYLEKMIASDLAYISEETPKEEGQRSSVVRFRNPNKEIVFEDLVRGKVTVDTTDLGDFVIAKSLDEPLYHLTVIIDDYEAGVTHVIRGEDHISNTPRQILLQEAVGAPRPFYAHMPMVLGADKTKLSKRHGAKPLLDYRDAGYLPTAMVNYLALLGWHPGQGDEQEIFTFNELLEKFNLQEMQKSGAVFSEEKLQWINKQHLDKLSDGVFFQAIQDWIPEETKDLPQYSTDRLARLVPELRERLSVYGDLTAMAAEGELEFYFDEPGYFVESLVWKKSTPEETTKHLKWLKETLQATEDSIWSSKDDLKEVIWPYAEKNGKGDVLWPLRYCLSGQDRSPDPISLLNILGKTESIKRIDKALEMLQA